MGKDDAIDNGFEKSFRNEQRCKQQISMVIITTQFDESRVFGDGESGLQLSLWMKPQTLVPINQQSYGAVAELKHFQPGS
jgi:hypothetical protein